jgi:hypothetical protein
MRLFLFQLWRRGDLELDINTLAQRQMMFVSRFWRQLIGVMYAHLNDGGYLKGLLWLFLKVIMERDWLGCDDVDERLDKLVFCLTRHLSGFYTQRDALQTHQAKYALARSGAHPLSYSSTPVPILLGRVVAPWL